MLISIDLYVKIILDHNCKRRWFQKPYVVTACGMQQLNKYVLCQSSVPVAGQFISPYLEISWSGA